MFSLQTNGTLLSEKFALTLNKLGINVGISLDGTAKSNENRVYKNNNRPALKGIINGIKNLQKVTNNRVGILSVINTGENPQLVYSFYKEIGIRGVSFLLPDLNYDKIGNNNVPPIGNWLIEMFNIWRNDEDKNKVLISPFDWIIYKIIGIEEFGNEGYGIKENDLITIKSNGDIDGVDSLKICKNGITKTGYNINLNSIDESLNHELFLIYYYAHFDHILNDKCKHCLIKNICGGGKLAHRYSSTNGFSNINIYCNELKKLILHIQNTIIDELPADVIKNCNIEKISNYELL